jgi:hypothetical protein
MSCHRLFVLIALTALVWAVLACSSKNATVTTRVPGAAQPDTVKDADMVSRDELVRELEAAMLENYLQLALGNMEAYADSVAREREIALMGIRPQDLIVGTNPQERLRARKHLPFHDRPHCQIGASESEPCLRLLPKTLDVHLYTDDSVGWITDEVSYRVPHEGREAAIPLRLSAVMMRDIDRWVLVMEHTSYGLPVSAIMELARKGELAAPTEFGDYHDDRNRARVFQRELKTFLNADAAASKRFLETMERTRPVPAEAYFLLLPGRRREYHGARMFQARSLASLFGPGAVVTIEGYRLSTAPNKRVAWMATRLAVKTDDPVSGRTLTIGLRGTFLFAFGNLRWHLVQAHISVPVTEAQIGRRLFGGEDVINPTEPPPEDAPPRQ